MNSALSNSDEFISETFVGLNKQAGEHSLSHKEFDNCTFKECDLSETVIEHCKFIECDFINCNLSLIKPKFSKFMDVSFQGCKLVGVDWTTATWSNLALPAPVQFNNCILTDCSFYGLSLNELQLTDCKAHEVDFREAEFNQANFFGSDFLQALFQGADLTEANFENAENYFIDIQQTRIRGAKFSRMEAVNLLASLEIELVD